MLLGCVFRLRILFVAWYLDLVFTYGLNFGGLVWYYAFCGGLGWAVVWIVVVRCVVCGTFYAVRSMWASGFGFAFYVGFM